MTFRKDPVTIVWIVGAIVTVLIYLAGPEMFFYWLFYQIDIAWSALEGVIHNLSRSAFNLLRAAAIGLFVVFVALSLLVIRSGRKGRAALLLVAGTFVLLVWDRGFYIANTRWVSALVLVGVGSLVMTRRLRGGGR